MPVEQETMQQEHQAPPAPVGPPMPLQNTMDSSEYFNNARNLVLAECCLSAEQIKLYLMPPQTGFAYVIPLRTKGDDNLVGFVPGMRRLYKHIFLQNKQFRQQVVDYYRQMGFGWVDIVTLNRVQSYLFLWPRVQ